MVNCEFLAKFKKLYKDKYNIDLSDEQTTELGTHFLNMMQILIKPRNKPESIPQDIQDNQVSNIESQKDLAYLDGGCE